MTQSLPTTLPDLSLLAAEKFLQTAVFIDDKIYGQSPSLASKVTPLVTPLLKRKPALKSAVTAEGASQPLGDALKSQVNDQDLSFAPQDIVSSFAKKRIVCSLYQPDAQTKLGAGTEAYDLCLASDIVIVDWDLHKDNGRKTLELVTALLLQSLDDVPEQLRLILVYTQELNLETINGEIFDKLNELRPGFVETKAGETYLHTTNTRIVVLGKPGNRLEKFKSSEVCEADLAGRAVAEFTELSSGLMQAAILLGLAEIRSNSRRILSKFDASLDAAFLTHRALSLPDEDASEHVMPLLSDELQSIMEDCLLQPVITQSLIDNWCAKTWVPSADAKNFSGTADVREFGRSFCTDGYKMHKKFPGHDKLKNVTDGNQWITKKLPEFKKISDLLHTDAKHNTNHQFAILMSQRTRYANLPRILQLGTVVKRKIAENFEYLLCLQPVCDSVRLIKDRNFVFCKFDITSNSGKKSATVLDGKTYVKLQFSPKPFNCITDAFSPESATKKVVANRHLEVNNAFAYKALSGIYYEWVGEMKPAHAQRAVEQFASNLSRVGLTESEWLRLSAK